ncbi:MAG: PAS domain-containing sensor histidine kinase [Taibaiella sp.]|nr:PAS domain-containing sensor histidine kinase [Taibaiella sp.]
MGGLRISLDEKLLNRLFPFYIFIDRSYSIISFGESLGRLAKLEIGQKLSEAFTVHSPNISKHRISELQGISFQMVIKNILDNQYPVLLQVQAEYISQEDTLLLIGSPSVVRNSRNDTLNPRGINNRELLDEKEEITNIGYSYPRLDNQTPDIPHSGTNIRGMVITDAKGAIEWASRDFETSVGYSLEEMAGKRPREIIYGKESTKVSSSYVDDMVKKKRPFSFINIGYNRYGKTFWFRTTIQLALSQDNEVISRYYFFDDITDLMQKEQADKENRQMWKYALEGTGHGIWSFRTGQKNLIVSEKFKELLGYGSEEAFDIDTLRLSMPVDCYNCFMTEILPSLRPNAPDFSFDCEMVHRNGGIRHFNLKGKVQEWDTEYSSISIFGTLIDITEQKQKDEELIIALKRITTLIENLNYGIVFENEKNEVILANKIFAHMFSYPIAYEELEGIHGGDIAEEIKYMFVDPKEYKKRTDWLLTNKEAVYKDILLLKDGRIIERDFIPIVADGRYLGHLWRYEDISERKKLEQSLETSEMQLTVLINNFSSAILFEDNKRNIVIANKTFKSILSKQIDNPNLDGQNTKNILSKLDGIFKNSKYEIDAIENLIEKGTICNGRKVELANGAVLEQQFIPISNDSIVIGYLWIYDDITEKLKAERKIIDQRAYYHRILNELPTDIMIMDKEHRFEFINKSAVKNDELRNWLIGKNMYDYCHIKNIDTSLADQREQLFKKTIATKKEQKSTDVHILADGSKKHMLRFLYPFVDYRGAVEYVVGFGIDITEQVNSELMLNEQKEYYQSILNELPSDIVIYDITQKCQFRNRQGKNSKKNLKVVPFKKDSTYIYENYNIVDSGNDISNTFKIALATKKPVRTVEENINKITKETRYMLRVLYPYIGNKGNIEYLIENGNDITDLIESNKKAEIYRERMKLLLDVVKEGVFICEKNGDIKYTNESFDSIFRRNKVDSSNFNNFFNLLTNKDRKNAYGCFDDLMKGKTSASCRISVEDNGEDRHLNFILVNSNVELNELVGLLYDITDIVNKEKNLENLLKQERELNNSKSQFIRISSHELRTPLAIILSNAEILEMINDPTFTNTNKLNQSTILGRIIKEVGHMTEILNQLMMVSKIEAGKIDFSTEKVNINTFLNEIKEDLYNPYIDGRVLRIEKLEDSDVYIDRRLMRHAVVNLISNAFKYSPGKVAPILFVKKEGNYLIINVRDFGIGIPETDRNKLMSAFFRASNVGMINGSGLGLMVVDYAIKKHGGNFYYTTELNRGSEFSITIPLIPNHNK